MVDNEQNSKFKFQILSLNLNVGTNWRKPI